MATRVNVFRFFQLCLKINMIWNHSLFWVRFCKPFWVAVNAHTWPTGHVLYCRADKAANPEHAEVQGGRSQSDCQHCSLITVYIPSVSVTAWHSSLLVPQLQGILFFTSAFITFYIPSNPCNTSKVCCNPSRKAALIVSSLSTDMLKLFHIIHLERPHDASMMLLFPLGWICLH